MVLTNKDLAIWFLAEAHYAGGHAGIEYAKTTPTAVDALTRVNVLVGDVKLKISEYMRTRLKAPGMGLGKGLVVTTGVEFPELEFSYVLQTLADPFKTPAVGGTEGAEGTSYIFQILMPDADESGASVRYDIFGAQLTSYSVSGSISSKIPPKVTVKFTCYSMAVSGGGVAIQTNAIPTGVINEWDDIIVTLDADAIEELDEYTLTITNEFTEIGSGHNSTFNKFKPLLKDKKLEYNVHFYKDAGGLMFDKQTQAVNNIIVIWTDGINTINVTNCYVDKDNWGELKGEDIDAVKHEVTIVNGNSVFT